MTEKNSLEERIKLINKLSDEMDSLIGNFLLENFPDEERTEMMANTIFNSLEVILRKTIMLTSSCGKERIEILNEFFENVKKFFKELEEIEKSCECGS